MTTSPHVEVICRKATGGHAPCHYRRRLTGDTADRPCDYQLSSIRTTLGKTASGRSAQSTPAAQP